MPRRPRCPGCQPAAPLALPGECLLAGRPSSGERARLSAALSSPGRRREVRPLTLSAALPRRSRSPRPGAPAFLLLPRGGEESSAEGHRIRLEGWSGKQARPAPLGPAASGELAESQDWTGAGAGAEARGPPPPAAEMTGRAPLAEKALSESHARLRYRDTAVLIWQQQQQQLETPPRGTYLSRSHSAWYSQYGNQAILVRDSCKAARDTGQSKLCTLM